MAAVRRLVLVVAAACAVAGPAAAAYTDPYLEKTLKAAMVKKFKTAAPKLKITKVKCVLPKNGVTAHCKATFTTSGIDGYYPVTATIHDNGQLTWTARSPRCLNPKTKKYAGC